LDYTLIKIRLQQINRESGGLGPFYILLFAAAIIYLEYALYLVYSDLNNSFWALGLLCVALLSIHLSRGDSRFVWHHLAAPKRKLFSEYLFFSLPFMLPALPTWQFWEVFVFLLFCFCLAQWKVHRPQKRIYWPWLGKLISPQDFEWLSGVRRYWLALVPLYLIIAAFCWVRALPIVGLWFVTMLVVSFYTEGEPFNIFRLHYKGRPSAFLWQKIWRATRLLSIIYIPFLLVNAVLHSDIFIAHIIFFLMQWVALVYAITAKYATYKPNEILAGNAVLQGFALMGTIIPFLAPLPIFLCFWYFNKAIINLKSINS
jgi:hypothetical protein